MYNHEDDSDTSSSTLSDSPTHPAPSAERNFVSAGNVDTNEDSQSRGGCRGRQRGGYRGHGRGRGRGRGRGCGQTSQATGCGTRRCGTPQQKKTKKDEWKWNTTKQQENQLHSVNFSGNLPGPTADAYGVRDPTGCFNLFMCDYYDQILQQSNLYANQERRIRADTSPWAPITKEELLAFIGLNIAMGVVSLPSIHDYWSTDIIRSHPWFHSVMSRDRFCQLLRYVHVADNSKALSRDDLNYDKLWKVRPMMNYLISRCAQLYDPHPQLFNPSIMISCIVSFKNRL